MSARPGAMLERAAKGTAAFEAAVHWLTDSGPTKPSYLPGWSRATSSPTSPATLRPSSTC